MLLYVTFSFKLPQEPGSIQFRVPLHFLPCEHDHAVVLMLLHPCYAGDSADSLQSITFPSTPVLYLFHQGFLPGDGRRLKNPK